MNQSLLRPRVGEQDLSTGFGDCLIYLFYLLVCLFGFLLTQRNFRHSLVLLSRRGYLTTAAVPWVENSKLG